MAAPGNYRGWLWLWGAGYVVLVVAVVWWIFSARRWAEAELTKPESTAAWETWRADVIADQHRPAPVQRRVPKSTEPPALVLMRDYFAVSLGGAVFFSSLLYWVIAWFVTGIFSAPQDAPRQDAAAK
jgi:hypothetical protein